MLYITLMLFFFLYVSGIEEAESNIKGGSYKLSSRVFSIPSYTGYVSAVMLLLLNCDI